MSNPFNITLIAELSDDDGDAEGINLVNNTIYLSEGDEGVEIIDVSDPYHPEETGQILDGRHNDVIGQFRICNGSTHNTIYRSETPDLLFIADDYGGFRIQNITNKYADTEYVSKYYDEGLSQDVEFLFDLVVVSNGANGVQVFDVTDPTSPEMLAHFDDGGYSTDLTVHDGLIYVSDGSDGIEVLELRSQIENPDGNQENENSSPKMSISGYILLLIIFFCSIVIISYKKHIILKINN